MSSSRPKITSIACTKCKQDFTFKRVSKMAFVTCPHCSTEIRITRRPAKTASPNLPAEAPLQAKAPAEESNGFPNINPPRTRKRINFNGLQHDDSDITDFENDQAPGVPPSELNSPPNPSTTPSDTSNFLPTGRRLRGNNLLPPPNPTPSPPPTASRPKSVNTPPNRSLIAPSGRRARSAPTSTEQSIQSQNPIASQLNKSVDASLKRAEPETETKDASTARAEREHPNSLLPPKFLVADIEADENVVVLPTATGGMQVVSRTEVTVSHDGQTIKLVASSPEELKRIRLIENLVAIVIAGIILAIAVWILL